MSNTKWTVVALIGCLAIITMLGGLAIHQHQQQIDDLETELDDTESNASELETELDAVESENSELREQAIRDDPEIENVSASCHRVASSSHACNYTVSISGDYDLLYVISPEFIDIPMNAPEKIDDSTFSGRAWEYTYDEYRETIDRHVYTVDVGPDGVDRIRYLGTMKMDYRNNPSHIAFDKPCDLSLDSELEAYCDDSQTELEGDSE
ncbi:hypothetical protein OB920_13190 [Halobacteria archaeon HArc-gm2]|nr:hypothetical protein [Halobacteria archaeon HArc-gm2]